MISTLKSIFIITFLIFISCSNGQEGTEPETDVNILCEEPEFLIELTESIPAKVKVVEDGQPFFNGSKKYYEVDVETYVPELFQRFNTKTQRVFSVEGIDSREGEEVRILGRISSCVTGHHGLLTNDLKGFTIINV